MSKEEIVHKNYPDHDRKESKEEESKKHNSISMKVIVNDLILGFKNDLETFRQLKQYAESTEGNIDLKEEAITKISKHMEEVDNAITRLESFVLIISK